jgi:hypothetical protein
MSGRFAAVHSELMRQVSLSAKGLANISMKNYENDFTFFVGQARYAVPSFVAELLSPRIGYIRSIDPTVTEFVISSKDRGHQFPRLLSMASGSSVTLTDQHAEFLGYICRELENQDLFDSIVSNSGKPLDIRSVIARLKFLNDVNADATQEIKFIASNFLELSESQLSELRFECLAAILSDESLKLESEDSLFRFISRKMKGDPASFSLLEFVEFDFLSPSVVSGFLDSISESLEFVTPPIWKRLRPRLVPSPVSSRSTNRFSGRFYEFRANSPLSGVIADLTKRSKQNVHKAGVVTITASSTYSFEYTPFLVADLKANSEWLSLAETDQWLSYDFGDALIRPDYYSIQSADVNRGSPRSFPRHWVLEGSLDGQTWDELDVQADNFALKGKSLIASFPVSRPATVRMIRIRQTGLNHSETTHFGFRALEIFGCLRSGK